MRLQLLDFQLTEAKLLTVKHAFLTFLKKFRLISILNVTIVSCAK